MSRRSFDVSEAKLLFVEALAESCEVCRANLWIRWHEPRFVQRLDGVYQLIRQMKVCPVCRGRAYKPPEDVRFALPRATYGTDVVVEVGERHLRGGSSLRAIGRDLNERGVPIDQTHMGDLFRGYVALTKLARGDDARVRERLIAQGGVLLMADGVQYDDSSPVLYLVWDALSGLPLFGERKSFKGKDDLVPLLERVKALKVPILGIVSDKEKGLFPAVIEVFPDVPYQVCQNHFMKNCAAGMSSDLTALSKSVSDRAESVQRIAGRLHRVGVNSVEWEVGSPVAAAEDVDDEAAAIEPDADGDHVEPPTEVAPTTVPAATSLTEEQLAAELSAMAKHAARATGRAPLKPPELVRHEGLNRVRAAVKEAAGKGGAHTRSSLSSTKRSTPTGTVPAPQDGSRAR
jgi:hypothetical protein